jgi:hypothetical protein
MTAPTLLPARIIAALEKHGETELASEYAADRAGEKVNGNTLHKIALARLWLKIQRRIDDGEDEADVLASEAEINHTTYESLCDLRAFNGRADIRRIVRQMEEEGS